jgi:hypothetical protein
MVTRHRRAEDVAAERRVRERAARFMIPQWRPSVLYHTRSRRDLQDVLTCLRHGSRSARQEELRDNAERAGPPTRSLYYMRTIRRALPVRKKLPRAARSRWPRSATAIRWRSSPTGPVRSSI